MAGTCNFIDTCNGFVGGGYCNWLLQACNSFIGGGYCNAVCFGCNSSVVGGCYNRTYGGFNAILGGYNNQVSASFSAAFGCNINAFSSCTFYVNNFCACGNLYAVSKFFSIDHPTKEGKTLQHAVLEGPEHSVFLRGKLVDSDTIELPDYWSALVHEDSITVNLTPVGKPQSLYVDSVAIDKIKVAGDNNINAYYIVYAERKDIEKLVPEIDKIDK